METVSQAFSPTHAMPLLSDDTKYAPDVDQIGIDQETIYTSLTSNDNAVHNTP